VKGRYLLDYFGVDARIKCVLNACFGRAWIGLNWLRIGSGLM
jgi:hypothetical protein